MVEERATDYEAGLIGYQWRCLNCGALVPVGRGVAMDSPQAPQGPQASPPRAPYFSVQNFSTKVALPQSQARFPLHTSPYIKLLHTEKRERQLAYGRRYVWRRAGYSEGEVARLEAAYQARGGKAKWGESRRVVGKEA